MIARLQATGLNATAVQNPLTSLAEAVASPERASERQDGPTVLVWHSFAGMIITEVGVHPNVSALVHVSARVADAGGGLHSAGQNISDATGNRRHRLRWR